VIDGRVIVEPKPRPPPFARARAFSVAKHDGDTNEDAWQCAHKGAGAVSDGASVSFDSASWSRILVRRYAQNPRFDAAWVAGAIAAFAGLHNRDSLPWMQQAAFDRGSFASLLGIADHGAGRVGVLAVGDSLAVLCDGDHVVASFPYEVPEQFNADPQLLSTNPAENKFLDGPGCISELYREWDPGPLENPALLCVTDALGRWILSERGREPSPIALLRGVGSRREFARLVKVERVAGHMRRDDTTLLAYWDWSAD